MGWSMPAYTRRRRNVTVRVSPFTRTKVSGSWQLGPLTVTATGRIYLFGARIK